MNKVLDFIKAEPALLLGAISALIALLLAFGVHLNHTQVGAIMAFITAVFAVILRQSVIPLSKLDNDGNFKEQL